MPADTPSAGAFFGIDVGARRIGVARADAQTRIATPFETVAAGRGQRPAAHIARILVEERCHTVVVGWPLTLDGEEGRATRDVDRFVDELMAAVAQLTAESATNTTPGTVLEVVRWDERMTTIAAEAFLIGADVSRRRRRQVVDQIAATHILQGYLDSLR